MRLTDIRSTFLEYFKQQHHTLVESSSLIPRNDPTLMFTAAGMVPFKNIFTGTEKRSYTRATSSQKCLRAGGKHNDLDNVGYTTRHHTFFEMLGNFSFGDYFKEEAIFYAWELVTKHLSLDPRRLLVTVYAQDEETASLWKKLTGFPDHKIIRINTSDNFWSMGDTGPCGPCTEIFYDHGESLTGGPPGSLNQEGDRFVEIWNLVFMQYEKLADGRRIHLPKPSVDTGMGLERMGAVLQGVQSNFETDLFKTLIEASQELSHNKESRMKQSHQVIADHLRASCFLLADGVLPSNEGRGYVLRRIMRRAMRHVHLLGVKEPLMQRLVPTLIDVMGVYYPELGRAETLIRSTLRQEEEKFHETLDRGLKLLHDEMSKLAPGHPLPGQVAFRLYDTFGFPVDLTADVLRGMNSTLDMTEFDAAMKIQKDAARAAWIGSGDAKHDRIWFDVKEETSATDFLGYNTLQTEGVVQAIVVNGTRVDQIAGDDLKEETRLEIVCNQTPFYGESGGQMGDRGFVVNDRVKAVVFDTVKPFDNIIVHRLKDLSGTLKQGDTLKLTVEGKRRSGLKQHHSVTHLLHAALRHILGDHIIQKGSLVEQDRLRFDFTHPKALSTDTLQAIEDWVNSQIQENAKAQTELKTPEEAIKDGAVALFGEKYGDTVRVVSMGNASTELCGGTHVKALGDIGLFKITSESGVSSGVRRIEAVAGMAALDYLRRLEKRQEDMAHLLKTPPQHMVEKILRLLEDQKALTQMVTDLRSKFASGNATLESIEKINGVSLLTKHLENYPAKDLKAIMDTLKKNLGSGIVLLSNLSEGKVTLLLGITDDLTEKFHAGHIIRDLSSLVGGQGGGGRPNLAQTGGSNGKGIEEAIQRLREKLG